MELAQSRSARERSRLRSITMVLLLATARSTLEMMPGFFRISCFGAGATTSRVSVSSPHWTGIRFLGMTPGGAIK